MLQKYRAVITKPPITPSLTAILFGVLSYANAGLTRDVASGSKGEILAEST
jgi:hypothetical protein